MSTVYRGTDLSLDRVVAVKVAMDPLLERDPVYASRFKREARAAAAISNPGIVTVFDAGADGPTRYIVMEYVEGEDLAAILRKERPLEIPRAVRIAEQVAGTLAAAHAAGIVHRDIKPGNIMVTPQGRVKVLDFGIARTSDGVNLTQTASVLGTAPYMSPEQAMGQPADARSDIYSLGCVLYEMLTGAPPFMGDLPAAVLHQHVRVAPKPPSARNPEVPPALDALVLEMLAKSPEDRPQTALEVRDRLTAWDSATEPTRSIAATEPTRPLLAVAPPPADPPGPTRLVPVAAETPPPTRRVPPARPPGGRGTEFWLVLALIAAVVLGGVVAYALANGNSSNPSSSSTSKSHSTPALTHSTTTPASSTSHSTSTPTTTSSSSSTSSSTPTTTTSSTTSSSTSSSTSTPTTLSTPTPPGQGGTPPGQGGTPPGQANKSATTP